MKTNGVLQKDRIQQKLSEPQTLGYRPTLPVNTFLGPDGMAPYFWLMRDIPLMLIHPMVKQSLAYYKSGIAGAEFWGGPDPKNQDNPKGLPVCADPDVSAFVIEQCHRYWDRGVPKLQRGYDFGWCGAENIFISEDNILKWSGLIQFAPGDTFMLTQDTLPVGVRVRHVQDKGQVDLWFATKEIPAKAMWYAHEPQDGQYYGRSQLIGAWRPWRRLAWKDGAETVLDGGVYRFAYGGVVIRYPEEDYEARAGENYATQDSSGKWMRYARDMAREMTEQFKAGAGIGLPSAKYPPDQGGDYKWTMELPSQVLNVDPILNYIKNLHDQISYGIGVPPEILQAAETGSGYSGRRIPLESFLDGQQRIGDSMLTLFVEQVLKPLVCWNWGPNIKFNVSLKRLLETKNKAQEGQQQPGGQPQQGQAPANPWSGPKFSQSPLVTDRVREIARKLLRAA